LELNIPKENLTIVSIEAAVTSTMTSKSSYDPWEEIAIVLAIFIAFILLVGFIGALVRHHAEREGQKFEEMKRAGEICTDRVDRKDVRSRKRRGIRITCCPCLSEERKKSLCPCCFKKMRKSRPGTTTQTLLISEESSRYICEAGMSTVDSKLDMIDGQESNPEATIPAMPEAGK